MFYRICIAQYLSLEQSTDFFGGFSEVEVVTGNRWVLVNLI